VVVEGGNAVLAAVLVVGVRRDEVPVGVDLDPVDAVCRVLDAAPTGSGGTVSPAAGDKGAANAR